MNEYSYKDIIIDPNSNTAKKYLNKEVYVGENAFDLLRNANSNTKKTILKEIHPNMPNPFIVENEEGKLSCYDSIIPSIEKEWFLCCTTSYDRNEIENEAMTIANTYGKDHILSIVSYKTGLIFKRNVFILYYWSEVNKRES